MTDIAARYRTVADGFTATLAGVPAGRWDAPSPCPDWTAREVAAHVVLTHRRVLAMAGGPEPVEVGADDDLGVAWEEASDALLGAVSDPEVRDRVVTARFGDMPFGDIVSRMVCADTLIHTWDLARAVGEDERLDPESVTHVATFLATAGDAVRSPGGFGPALEPPAGADEQTRLICLAGRAP
jgi:uncharacterized protein (TIGR03086 family)